MYIRTVGVSTEQFRNVLGMATKLKQMPQQKVKRLHSELDKRLHQCFISLKSSECEPVTDARRARDLSEKARQIRHLISARPSICFL